MENQQRVLGRNVCPERVVDIPVFAQRSNLLDVFLPQPFLTVENIHK